MLRDKIVFAAAIYKCVNSYLAICYFNFNKCF
jgi:hypothetical protein